VSEDRFKKSVDLYLDESIVASYEFEILTNIGERYEIH
tara:strand:- start:1532 stop:1645 length:114 start_codon:yes stop_codon:yes gene_type:complete